MVNITEKYIDPNGYTVDGATYTYGGECNEFTPDTLLSTHPDPSGVWLTVEKYPPIIGTRSTYSYSNECFSYEGVDEQGLYRWRPTSGLCPTYHLVLDGVVHAGNNFSLDSSYNVAGAISARFEDSSSVDRIYNGENLRYIIGAEGQFALSNVQGERTFYGCRKLCGMNLSRWDVSGATSLVEMFYDCESMTKLNLSGWDVSQKTSAGSFRYSNKGYESIMVNYFSLSSNVGGLEGMFSGCTSLSEITGLEDWNIGSTNRFGIMFAGCQSLKSLDLSNWSLANNTTIPGMFYDTGLEELSIAGWDVTKLSSPSSSKICQIIGGTTFNTLRVLDVSGFEVGNLPNNIKSNFFEYSGLKSKSVTTVRAYGLSDASVTYLQGWFPNAEILR